MSRDTINKGIEAAKEFGARIKHGVDTSMFTISTAAHFVEKKQRAADAKQDFVALNDLKEKHRKETDRLFSAIRGASIMADVRSGAMPALAGVKEWFDGEMIDRLRAKTAREAGITLQTYSADYMQQVVDESGHSNRTIENMLKNLRALEHDIEHVQMSLDEKLIGISRDAMERNGQIQEFVQRLMEKVQSGALTQDVERQNNLLGAQETNVWLAQKDADHYGLAQDVYEYGVEQGIFDHEH